MTWENSNTVITFKWLHSGCVWFSYYLNINSTWCWIFVYVRERVTRESVGMGPWWPCCAGNMWTEASVRPPHPSHTSFSFLFSHTCSSSLPEESEMITTSIIASWSVVTENMQLFFLISLLHWIYFLSLCLGRIFKSSHIMCRWSINQLNLTVNAWNVTAMLLTTNMSMSAIKWMSKCRNCVVQTLNTMQKRYFSATSKPVTSTPSLQAMLSKACQLETEIASYAKMS